MVFKKILLRTKLLFFIHYFAIFMHNKILFNYFS